MASLRGIYVAIIHERDQVGGTGAVAAKSISRSVNLFLAQHLSFLPPLLPSFLSEYQSAACRRSDPNRFIITSRTGIEPLPPLPPAASITISNQRTKQRRNIWSSPLPNILLSSLSTHPQAAELRSGLSPGSPDP